MQKCFTAKNSLDAGFALHLMQISSESCCFSELVLPQQILAKGYCGSQGLACASQYTRKTVVTCWSLNLQFMRACPTPCWHPVTGVQMTLGCM